MMENLLKLSVFIDLFIPYEKGKNGNFGLGLAIVKKIANTFNCSVSAKNHKEGVSFIVKAN
jgi:two-component system, OmpR family, sensor histidine kinase CssS